MSNRFFKNPEIILLSILMGFYITVAVVLNIVKYYHSYDYSIVQSDLAVINQFFWNASHGKLFTTTIQPPLFDVDSLNGFSFFRIHLFLILFLLLPIYKLFPHPISLLVMKEIFIAIGAIPLYLIAREKFNHRRWIALIFPFFNCLVPGYTYHIFTLCC